MSYGIVCYRTTSWDNLLWRNLLRDKLHLKNLLWSTFIGCSCETWALG